MNWIELFSVGTHTDSSGKTHTFTADDLDRVVATFDPAKHEPPLVLGHPKDDGPAWGWVAALKRQGGKLLGAFKDVPPVIQELVDKGRYKKRSISLYPDGRLRHVGLLGAATPAVQGLKDIAAFAAGDDALEFTETLTPETDMTPEEMAALIKKLEAENALLKAKAGGADAAKIAELEAQLKELQEAKSKAEADKAQAESAFAEAQKSAAQKDLEAKVDALVSGGKLLPKDKPSVLAFAQALQSGGELEFSEGSGKKPLQTHFFDFLGQLTGHGLTQEFTAPTGSGAAAEIPYADIMNKV